MQEHIGYTQGINLGFIGLDGRLPLNSSFWGPYHRLFGIDDQDHLLEYPSERRCNRVCLLDDLPVMQRSGFR